MIFGILLGLFTAGDFSEWFIFIRCLQFILHIPLMNIAIPGNVI